jgi:hypothetical protein
MDEDNHCYPESFLYSSISEAITIFFDYSIIRYERIEAEVAEGIATPCDKLAGSQVIEHSKEGL